MTLAAEEPGEILNRDAQGRVLITRERRELLLEQYDRSGMSGVKFAEYIGIKYSTLAYWLQSRRRKGEREKSLIKAGADTEPSKSNGAWIIGALDWPLKPIDFVPQPHPAGIDIKTALKGADLGAMLEAGKIDALISADVPKCFLEKSPKVARLFPDYVATERAYFQRTGVFPIMHTVVVRKELAAECPDILHAVYKGFCDAKDAVQEQYKKGMIFNNMATMMPWFSKLVDEDLALLGNDWWPYGLAANRKAVDAFLRYHFEQGLSKQRLACEDIFVRALLQTKDRR
jgi:hypothetical protein